MSHLVTIDVEITDLQAVADAAAAKGWVFDAEATSYKGWYGEEPCKGKISIPGEHREMEIGFVQAANGSLVPGYDDLTRDPVSDEYLSEANGLCGFVLCHEKDGSDAASILTQASGCIYSLNTRMAFAEGCHDNRITGKPDSAPCNNLPLLPGAFSCMEANA